MMTDEWFTKIVNFMTPGVGFPLLRCGHINYMVKIHYFFKKNSSLLPGTDQTNLGYSNDVQGRVQQNCKYMKNINMQI